eukprot:jgi/Psemu1/20061/gm1.20061_g
MQQGGEYTSNSNANRNTNTNTNYDATRAVFLISMGEQAKRSRMVERFVWSARNRGRWDGWIVLLTDAPIDRYNRIGNDIGNRIGSAMSSPSRSRSRSPSRSRFIVMNPEPRHFNTSFREDMPYKRFKTRVIEYVDKDPRLNAVRLIYYLDVDNIVGNSLPKMFEELESKYNIPGNGNGNRNGNNKRWLREVPRMWFFANKYKHLSVQGGQFVVDRYGSQPCLDAWREKIDANVSEPKDQPALHKIRGNGRNQRCQIVAMMPRNHVFFPDNSTIHKLVDGIRARSRGGGGGGEVATYPTLVHIKNSCNQTASIPTEIEEIYVGDIVQNPEYSKKIHVRPDDNNNKDNNN